MYYHHQPIYQRIQRKPQESTAQKSEIKVTGEGSLSVQPDMAKVSLGVETESLELKDAQSDNAEKIANIKQSIMSLGIGEENIQTDNFTIYPLYEFIDGKQTFRGYRVEHMLRITVGEVQNVGVVVDTAVNHGANRVSNISFEVEDTSNIYQRALEMAVQDAYQKASTIAHSLHVELVQPPLRIREERTQQTGPIPFHETSTMVKSASTEIEPGTQKIRAIVTAVFTTG